MPYFRLMDLSPDDLRVVTELTNLPEDQLEWILANSTFKTLKVGEHLFEIGDPIDTMYIFLEGEVDIRVERKGQYKSVASIRNHEISGALPFSRATNAIGNGVVTRDVVALLLPKSTFKEITSNFYELTEVLVHKMTTRTREFAKNNVQREKMMALGKLSAGLAHELNNPAAAMARSAKELKRNLKNVPEKFKRVISIKSTPEQIDAINEVLFEKINYRPENNMSLMERSDKEEELEYWLEDRGVDNAYNLTETLLDFCMDTKALEKIYEATGEDNFPSAIEWIENVLTTEKMVDEIDEAANRISSLVASVKGYTHMDSAPEKQAEDLGKGIKSTLTMLNHKLKKKNIAVEKEFEEDVPHPKIMVSEINQVWTNLIDNAIDAMEKDGILKIRLYKDLQFVKTEIIDNGSGIPEEHLHSIFDPFFTTKAIGEGTGLGLEVVQRIINQHKGDIKVESKPGETKFTVCIPVE